MRRQIFGAALFAAGVFGAGYIAGQAGGIGAIQAASKPHQTTPATGTTANCPKPGAFAGGFRHGLGAFGQVTVISGNTVTIKAATRPNDADGATETQVTTITLTSSTTYMSGAGTTAKASDIKVGSFVAARGTLSSDGKSLTATSVYISNGAPTGLHTHGLWHGDWGWNAPSGANTPSA